MRQRLSIDIETHEKQRAERAAALHGVSLSRYVLEALETRLKNEPVESTGSLAGSLSSYADASKRTLEQSAWSDSVAENQ